MHVHCATSYDSVCYCVYYIYIEGAAGKQSDGGILGNSLFGQALENGDLNFPDYLPLPGLF